MAEYIDLNNTEVLAEAGENAKLVVEEDGELKRIPASAVGQVKTVNGVEPDEAGNVGVSYNNLLDRPFYEEELLCVKPTVDPNNIGFAWRKVSDNNLSTPLENGFNAQAWYGGVNGTVNVMVVGDLVIYGEAFAVFVKKANAVLDCMAIGLDTLGFTTIFPEVGMYFLEKPEPMPFLGLAVAGASEPEIAWDGSSVRIKPLDAKFLPTTVPVIQSATVGQTVVVKAVDAEGKPTEWEAVDASAGGGTTVYQGGNGNGDDKHLYHVDIDSGEIGSIVTREEFIQAFKTGPIYVNDTFGGMEPQIINNCWISNVYCFVEYYLGNSENSTRYYTAEYTGGVS